MQRNVKIGGSVGQSLGSILLNIEINLDLIEIQFCLRFMIC